jgi:putative heme-binding domain-containing protein
VGTGLFAVGDGPQGTGMYLLPDADGDDVADSVTQITGYRGGMGEHGPHDVVLGPDGWLYHNLGNHSWIEHPQEPTSGVRAYYEGDLLRPRLEDPNGHAAGIPAPGGTVWRFTPDGRQWFLETNGFRNHYDIAFNQQGELFTFDSDMEWEVGMPFYKPVRVCHCTEGADFGWRSNAGKWPSYYFDSLPTAIDVGRGSPTGVVFYEHTQFPEKYRGAMLLCDWSMGRILVGYLQPDGASYTGTFDTLVSGNPLNVSDIEVDRDGTVVFCTGGRGTEGGVYRVSWVGQGAQRTPATVSEPADLVSLPQPSAAWHRELVLHERELLDDPLWEELLVKTAVEAPHAQQRLRALSLLAQFGPQPKAELLVRCSNDESPDVRAFATWLLGNSSGPRVAEALAARLADVSPLVKRRACEAYVRSGLEPPLTVSGLLASPDRFVRYHARLALEHVPPTGWKTEVLGSRSPRVKIGGLLALARLGAEALPPDDVLAAALELWQEGFPQVADGDRLDLLRVMELALLAGAQGDAVERLRRLALEAFAADGRSADAATARALDMELGRILSHLQTPGAAEKIVAALEAAEGDRELQIHYAFVSGYLKSGWTPDLERRMFAWYDGTRDWEGGHSFGRWLENIMAMHLERASPEHRRDRLADWAAHPYAARLVLLRSDPAQIADYESLLGGMIEALERDPAAAGGQDLVAVAVESLGRTGTPAAQEALQKLFDSLADRRELVVRAMAAQKAPSHWPLLVKSLDFADSTTLQLAIAALREMDQKPDKPAAMRAAIVAGLRLGDNGGLPAAALVEKWTGEKHDPAAGATAALTHYQGWFAQTYPDETPAELPAADAEKTRYTIAQLVEYLDGSGSAGDAVGGREVFTKANCAKCHKFGAVGEGVGPDLTSVRRRFQRREIVESLLAPSQVISDQYRSLTVLTIDGQIHTGMPLPNQGEGKVVLLLPDAKRLEIPNDQIDEQSPARVSVMPEGVLKDLSLEEIADLFALLETSKQAAGP